MVVIKPAELVKIVERGYRVVGRTENGFIPAYDLIPFGRAHEFNGNVEFQGRVNLRRSSRVFGDQETKIVEAARQYADRMGAPYFEVEIDRQTYPGGFFQTFRKATVISKGKVQLYVENKPQQRGQEVSKESVEF